VRRLVTFTIATAMLAGVLLAGTAPAHAVAGEGRMIGHLDSITLGGTNDPLPSLMIKGWTFNSLTSSPRDIDVQFLATSAAGKTTTIGWANGATLPRPDVDAKYHMGSRHGFDTLVSAPGKGTWKICARGWSLYNMPVMQPWTQIGCMSYTLPAEHGQGEALPPSVDLEAGQGALDLSGWVADTWGDPTQPFYDLDLTLTDPAEQASEKFVSTAHFPVPDITVPSNLNASLSYRYQAGPSILATGRSYTMCATGHRSFNTSVHGAAFAAGCSTPAIYPGYVRPTTTVEGTAVPGNTLTASIGSWDVGAHPLTFAWERDGAVVEQGSDATTYTVQARDVGHSLGLVATSSRAGYMSLVQRVGVGTVALPGVHARSIQGQDRYATAVAVSQQAFPDATAGVPVAFIASGTTYPDALSAGPAAAKLGGVLLLTARASLPASVRDELIRLHPKKIVIVGGTGVVSGTVASALQQLPFHPTLSRLAGADRYATSRAVADYAFRGGSTTVYLATGRGYADATAAGSAAAAHGQPVLLTDGAATRADTATRAELTRLHTTDAILAGGTAAIGSGVAATLGTNILITRASGADRYGTAIALAKLAFPSASNAYVANAYDYPDSLSVTSLAARQAGPLLLTDGKCLSSQTIGELQALHATNIGMLGGYGVMDGRITNILLACD
jgi:putative cell wall-binding protein